MTHGRSRFKRHLLFFGLDVMFLWLAMFSTAMLTQLTRSYQFDISEHLLDVALISLVLPLGHLAFGLYETKVRESIRAVCRRLVVSSTLTLPVAAVVHSFISNDEIPTAFMFFSLILASVAHAIWRHWGIFNGGFNFAKKRILFVGAGERASFITRRMRRDNDRRHMVLLGFVSVDGNETSELSEREVVYHLDESNTLDLLINQQNPDVIVMANDANSESFATVLLEAKMAGVEVVDMEDFVESELGQLAVEKMSEKWLIRSSGFHFNSCTAELLSAAVNKFLAICLLFFVWPIMVIAALAIYFDDGRRTGSPIFYKQIRVGINGKEYGILKFRSMGVDAEKDGAQWASKNDMRVTRIGGFMRKYRVDELPQLLNVLKGDMNFVGPRPERPEFVVELEKVIPFYKYRHCVKPGLSGWALLKYPYGASVNDSLEKLKFDLYYIKHRSLLMDLFILIRTVEVVLFGKGR